MAIIERMKIHSMKHITKKIKLKKLEDTDFYYVPLSQHIGQIAKSKVKVGDYVKQYEIIGEMEGGISSMIHSPVSGYVEEILENPIANGRIVKTIKIKNDYKYESEKLEKKEINELDNYTKEEIFEILKNSGIVGEGGAQFPTYIKYNIAYKTVDTLILNGAECEPYLTSDYTVMNEFTEQFFNGIEIAKKLLNPKKVVVAVEDENLELIEKLQDYTNKNKILNVYIQKLLTSYPQGSELQLIKTVTGKEIRKGDLPLNHGIIVSNVGTVKSIYDAVIEGKPLIERILTISGEKSGEKGNYLVKIGTPLEHIINLTKPDTDAKIVFGGPMMGERVEEMKTPVIKGTSGILFLSYDIDKVERNNCISCGSCVEVCPMGLMPLKFAEYFEKGKYKKLAKFNIDNCLECAACEFVCPSRVPLIKSIKQGKMQLMDMNKGGRK